MAQGALFVGWGEVVRGRENISLQVFNEFIEYLTDLQQRGEIDGFEPVALEPHGGDLQGFALIRGDRERLNQLRYSAGFIRMVNRGGTVVDSFGVVTAFVGEELQRLFASYPETTADLVPQG